MIIKTNNNVFNVCSKEEVESIILGCKIHQFDDILIHGETEYPCMTILLNGDNACIHYYFNDSKIYISKGNKKEKLSL